MQGAYSLGIPQLWFAAATHGTATGDARSPVMHFAVLSGVAIVEVSLAATFFFNPVVESAPSNPVPAGCQPQVELRSAAAYAKELGKAESWTAANYRVNLWSSLTNDRWTTGELVPGGRAIILGQNEYGYKVMTGDGIEGWVSNFQVSRTLRQDTGDQHACD